MTNSLERFSLDSLDDLLDLLKDPFERSRNERTLRNRLKAPLFSALGYFNNNETKQTEIIRSLLDPKERHGQGTLFLRYFLTKAWPSIAPEAWPEDELQCVTVLREHYIDREVHTGKASRPIDLWIHIDNYRVLAIESKAKGAPDQERQVEAYLNYMKKRFRTLPYKLLYLSPDGSQPSCVSITTEDWNQARDLHAAEAYCYAVFIRDWLERCKTECESDRVRFFIEDLIAFVDSSDERLTMPLDEICPEILALLRYPSADMEARRDTLLSIWELSDHILDEIMRTFQAKLCSRLLENGMLIDSDGDLADIWGWVVARNAPVGNGVPYVAVEHSYKGERSHLTVGIKITGMEPEQDGRRFKQWQEAALSSSLGKGTGDPKWIWQEIPQGFENMRSRDAALKLLDPKTADEVAIRMKDRLIAFEECR
jgi:hypothetical protein